MPPDFSGGFSFAQFHPATVSPATPIVAGFFMPCPCGGSSGVLSGLFFGGIHCRSPTLSACICFLVPSRHRRRTIPLLQGRDRACTGRFPGVASCTTSGILRRPGRCGGPWRHRLRGQGQPFPARKTADFSPEFWKIFSGNFSRIFRRS